MRKLSLIMTIVCALSLVCGILTYYVATERADNAESNADLIISLHGNDIMEGSKYDAPQWKKDFSEDSVGDIMDYTEEADMWRKIRIGGICVFGVIFVFSGIVAIKKR